MMDINAKTALNFVIGNPVAQSQSPAFHSQIYQKMGINAVMLALENPNLSQIIQTIKNLSVKLTAVTLPYKTEILQYVDEMSEAVKSLQAANTLIFKDGKIHAHNTDVDGILAVLSELTLNNKKILILGAGGSALALAYALKNSQSHIFYFNRTAENAQNIADQFGGEVIHSFELNKLVPDLIINTTPVGMFPNVDQSPLPHYTFQEHQIVFDFIYNPCETLLLKEAATKGAQCISGRKMFEHQARKQIELCYGKIL